VASDIVFRIASISKTFPVLALLLDKTFDVDDLTAAFITKLMGRDQEPGLVLPPLVLFSINLDTEIRLDFIQREGFTTIAISLSV
jgi:hypothetical protein